MLRIEFSLLNNAQQNGHLPTHNPALKTIAVIGGAGSGKSLNSQAFAEYFGCNLIIESWDGETPLPPGSLALMNSHSFDKSLVTDYYDIADALLMIQNNTSSPANKASFSK